MKVSTKVSVIIPVYNGSSYLLEVLESVVHQAGVTIEVVVVDDGSTDNTPQIIQEFRDRNKHLNIVILTTVNQGESSAVNLGLSHSSGEFVAVVNADDPLLEGHLETMTKAMLEHADVVVAYPDWLMINQCGTVVQRRKSEEFSRKILIDDFICLPGPGAVIRKSAIERGFLRDRDYRYVSDFESWIYLSSRGHFLRVPLFLATWRMHANNATSIGQGAAIAKEHIRLAESIKADSRASQRSLLAHAYFVAATQGLKSKDVQTFRYLARSIILKPLPTAHRHRRHRSVRIFILLLLPKLGRFIYRKWFESSYQGERKGSNVK